MSTFLRPFLFGLLLSVVLPLSAQYLDHIGPDDSASFFGIRGGASLATQNWSGIEMRPLLTYHVDAFVETLPEEGRFSLWASLGYHVRGSRLQRSVGIDFNNNVFQIPGENFQFRNASLMVGGKQIFKYTKVADIYYTLGLRLDYTINTNLRDYDALTNFRGFFPSEDLGMVRRINYGFVAGGGFDIPLSDKVGAVVQLTAHPDFSIQYDQAPIENVIDPYRASNTSIPQRRIRNFTLELSVGFRFLRKVEYID